MAFYPEDMPQPPQKAFIDTLSQADLRKLRAQIDEKLPSNTIKSLNLETELVTQYQRVLDLQEEVLTDSDVPANQRAQVAGQVASTLQQLIKMQIDLNLATQLRMMEEALVESLANLPSDAKDAYFVAYERIAKGKGL